MAVGERIAEGWAALAVGRHSPTAPTRLSSQRPLPWANTRTQVNELPEVLRAGQFPERSAQPSPSTYLATFFPPATAMASAFACRDPMSTQSWIGIPS